LNTQLECATEPKKLVILPDGTHHYTYRESHFDTVADITGTWLLEHP